MNLGALLDLTIQLKNIYFETALETGYEPGPEHFGYLMRVLVADTDEQAQEIGQEFLWTEAHRQRGPPLSSTTRRATSPGRRYGSR